MILAQQAPDVVTYSKDVVSWFAVSLIGFLLLVGLVLLIALVVNRKTRPIGLGVLGVVGLIGGVLLLMVLMPVVTYRSGEQAVVGEYPVYHRGPSQPVAQQTESVGSSEELIRAYEAVAESYADSTNVIDVESSPNTATEVEESTDPPTGDAAVGDETDPPAIDAVEESTPPAATPAQSKPEWLISPPKRIRGSFHRVIESGPFTTVDECDRRLNELMMMATAEYMDDLYGTDEFAREYNSPITHLSENNPSHRVVRARLSRLSITPSYIRDHIRKKYYVETVQRSVGPMKQAYVLMEFDEEVQNNLRRRWKDSQLEDRLVVVGTGSSAVLLLLGTIFGFFKLDTATKGYYTKRLIFGALLVTMAVGSFVLVVVDEFTRYL